LLDTSAGGGGVTLWGGAGDVCLGVGGGGAETAFGPAVVQSCYCISYGFS
jgi:hypothetical protein